MKKQQGLVGMRCPNRDRTAAPSSGKGVKTAARQPTAFLRPGEIVSMVEANSADESVTRSHRAGAGTTAAKQPLTQKGSTQDPQNQAPGTTGSVLKDCYI